MLDQIHHVRHCLRRLEILRRKLRLDIEKFQQNFLENIFIVFDIQIQIILQIAVRRDLVLVNFQYVAQQLSEFTVNPLL